MGYDGGDLPEAAATAKQEQQQQQQQQEQEQEQEQQPKRKFQELPLCTEIKKAVSEGFGYEYLTDVQASTFDAVVQGLDLVARARTGAGKTLSFLVPAME